MRVGHLWVLIHDPHPKPFLLFLSKCNGLLSWEPFKEIKTRTHRTRLLGQHTPCLQKNKNKKTLLRSVTKIYLKISFHGSKNRICSFLMCHHKNCKAQEPNEVRLNSTLSWSNWIPQKKCFPDLSEGFLPLPPPPALAWKVSRTCISQVIWTSLLPW